MVKFYLLKARDSTKLADEFKAEWIALLQAPKLDISKPHGFSSINFMSASQNILLHMSFRPGINVIVFNSKTKDGAWGPEERISFMGRFGMNPIIGVYDHGDRYQVLFDNETVIYYNKRIHETATMLQYNVDAGKTAVFGEALGVNTYSSFGEISPA
ncbi:hypothetical protein FA15DRAFT_653495 [Coprinopsis marcescibilis]|uniref:Galectin n=1 Tax=Coprinopsis marcescibilis TaxID=230819 RepID=A0A5C3L4I6_COPMA|nr:hypothetical protein FA15DRAFT_653495 [Coprinopsis marcescibilis]